MNPTTPERDTNYDTNIRALHGTHAAKWTFYPITDPIFLRISSRGLTFYKKRNDNIAKLKKNISRASINYGVLTKELLEIMLSRKPMLDPTDPLPFAGSTGLAICFGLHQGNIVVYVSTYTVSSNGIKLLSHDGQGGENLTPVRIG